MPREKNPLRLVGFVLSSKKYAYPYSSMLTNTYYYLIPIPPHELPYILFTVLKLYLEYLIP